MANKTIYIADEDLVIFQKAQEVAGESISKVIAKALRQYVNEKDLEGTDLKECEALSGYHGKEQNVEKARFIGKMLSEIMVEDKDGFKFTYTLYFTRKANFLLQVKKVVPEYIEDPYTDYCYEIIDDFTKLYNRDLPLSLIKEAEEKLGRSHVRFLDI